MSYSKAIQLVTSNEEGDHATLRPWSDLPLEFIEEFAARLSWVDQIHFKAVCKKWSSVSCAIQTVKHSPVLMYTSGIDGECSFFNPLDGNTYTMEIEEFSSDEPLALRFSKNGWVVVSEGDYFSFIINPITNTVINLPELDHWYSFHALSFSSSPRSSEFLVMGIGGVNHVFVRISWWRHGDDSWRTESFHNNLPFQVACTSPVFHHGLFYCLGIDGNLGVFNPVDMRWRVLDRPKPIRPGVNNEKIREDCYLVESNGEILSVFLGDVRKPVLAFRLDESKMSWRRVEDLGKEMLFLDVKNSLSVKSSKKEFENRMYFPRFSEDDHRKGVYYSTESHQYYPRFYGVEEPVDCVWIEPSLYDD